MKKDIHSIDWTPDRIASFWEHQNQRKVVYFSSQAGDNIYQLLKPFLKDKTTILDYGCGDGSMIEILLSHRKFACGVDFAESAIQTVNRKFSNRDKFLGAFTIDELPNIQNKFDVVFAFEVIEHLQDENLEGLVNNITHLLKPGGLLVLTTPNAEHLEESFVFCPNCKVQFHQMQHVRSWNENNLKTFIEAKGFETLKIITTTLRAEKRPLRDIIRVVKTLVKGKINPVNLIWIGKLKSSL